MRFFLITLILSLSLNAMATSIPKSLLGKGSGKWLATLSIGGSDLVEGATDKLSDSLKDQFISSLGGDYELAVELSDTNASIFTGDLHEFFYGLRDKVRQFKRRFPDRPAMLVLGLLGHGTVSDGHFYFATSDGKITGEQLVDLVSLIEADELIIFIQSCFSGGVTSGLFPQKFKQIANNKKRVAVISPVSSQLASPVFIFEEILSRSNNRSADYDSNGIITYEEWINSILSTSYRNAYYLDSDLVGRGYPLYVGIDIQIFDYGISSGLPMFATERLNSSQELTLGEYSKEPTELYQSTIETQWQESSFIHSLLDRSLDGRAFYDLLLNTREVYRVKRLLLLLAASDVEINDQLADVINQLFQIGDTELKTLAVSIFDNRFIYSGDSSSVDGLYDSFADAMYETESEYLKRKIKSLLFRVEHPW